MHAQGGSDFFNSGHYLTITVFLRNDSAPTDMGENCVVCMSLIITGKVWITFIRIIYLISP